MSKWKRDSLIQAWVDRKDLATCTLALFKLGYHPRNISEVVALVLQSIAGQQETKIESTEQAIEVLGRLGIDTNLNPSGRGLGNLKKNLSSTFVEVADMEGIDDAVLEQIARREIEKIK